MELGPGSVIGGRYAAERRLGAGGVGEVWAGRSISDGSRVAIKKLLPAAAAHRELVARFKREAKFLSRISSQYVARVIDFLSDDEHGLVLVLELIEGEALSEVLKSQRLSVEQAIEVAWDVLGGLADLHRQQIVHRDLKPGNVILRAGASGGTHAVIVDFGMSRLSGVDNDGEEVTALTRADIAVGTIEYMAPEQILNSRGVTGTADIYAVGAMLYRAVAGEHVFAGFDDLALLARHKMISDPTPLVTGRSDPLARGFEAIVMRMLRRLPAQRYARAADALADLAALRAGNFAAATSDAEPPLASEPALPASSAPTHPLVLPAPQPAAHTVGPDRAKGSGRGRVLGLVASVILVAGAASALAFSLHRRGQVAEEASDLLPLDEPRETEPRASAAAAVTSAPPSAPPAASAALALGLEPGVSDAGRPKPESATLALARGVEHPSVKHLTDDARRAEKPKEPRPSSSAAPVPLAGPSALPVATPKASAAPKPVDPAPVQLEESE